MTQTDQPQSGALPEQEIPPTADASVNQAESGEAPLPAKGLPVGMILAALAVALLAVGAVLTWDEWRGVIAPAPAPVVQRANGEIDTLRAELDRIRQRVETLEARPALESAPVAPAATNDLTAVDSRIDSVENAIRTLAQRPQMPADLADTVAALSAHVAELRRSAADSATVLRLADRVEQVEAQLRDMQQQRGSAAAMLLAVGQLREAVNGAMPFEAELRTVRALAPSGLDIAEPVDILKRRAASGIPTRLTLARRFDQLAADLVRADVLPQGQGWWRDTLTRLSGLLIVRREDGQAAGDGTASIVARAGTRLAETDLAGAVAEATALSGPAAEHAAPWLADAQARLAADKALSALTAETLTALGPR